MSKTRRVTISSLMKGRNLKLKAKGWGGGKEEGMGLNCGKYGRCKPQATNGDSLSLRATNFVFCFCVLGATWNDDDASCRYRTTILSLGIYIRVLIRVFQRPRSRVCVCVPCAEREGQLFFSHK